MNEWLWNCKPWQAFKNFAIVFSFVLNLVFLVLIILGARYIIPVTNEVAEPVVSGLNDSFEEMESAHIRKRIAVRAQGLCRPGELHQHPYPGGG